MAVYCIGDLHGQYDLFMQLLTNINFNYDEDHLYILGDAIDCNYGGIKILKYIMRNERNMTFILGNHEKNFLYHKEEYDFIMMNNEIKEIMIRVTEVWSENLFSEIAYIFERRFNSKDRDVFYRQPAIQKWLKKGVYKVRLRLLDAMVDLAERCSFDKKQYSKVKTILADFSNSYKVKHFLRELLKETTKDYLALHEFLRQCPNDISIRYANRNFNFVHDKRDINQIAGWLLLPSAKTEEETTYIFGHTPVPKLHYMIKNIEPAIDFSYNRIFSWITPDKNRFIDIDLGTDAVALKLDDMSEYYVRKPTRGNREKSDRYSEYLPLSYEDDYYYINNSDKNMFITRNQKCCEFIIRIKNEENMIIYKPIGWIDGKVIFYFQKSADNQTIANIVGMVKNDFTNRRNEKKIKNIERCLRGEFDFDTYLKIIRG